MIEKGDRGATDIYKILNRDLVRLCCEGIAWINREEDLGVEGLRTIIPFAGIASWYDYTNAQGVSTIFDVS